MTKKIKINGQEYPASATMGAYLLFTEETGRDVTELNVSDVSDLLTWVWCCVVSACRRDGVAFDISLSCFADYVLVEDVLSWVRQVPPSEPSASGSPPSAKKKGKSKA